MTAGAEVARVVREYIEAHGWIQGRARDSDGAVCLYGAVCTVGFNKYMNSVFLESLCRKIGTTEIGRWNDAPGRTYEDVILLLKQIEADEEGS